MPKIVPAYTLDEMVVEEEAQQAAQRGLLINGESPLAFVSGPSEYVLQFDTPEEMQAWLAIARKSGMKFPDDKK